jgi:hypothetical protein
MCRTYGTHGYDPLLINGLKSVATKCFEPKALLMGISEIKIPKNSNAYLLQKSKPIVASPN